MSTSKVTDPASLLGGLSSSFDHSPWAVTELSGEAHIVRYANSAFCRLFDKARDEVIGRPFDRLLSPADECLALLDRVFRTGAAASYTAEELAAPCPLLFSYSLWPLMADGRTAGVMILVNETGPLHETRHAISQALLLGALRQDELIEATELANVQLRTEISAHRQREIDAKLLANEVAHRVKNNLQVIASLITTEIRRTPAPWVRGFEAMQDRVIAIAQLYDLISQSSGGRTVALGAYLKEIAATLSASVLGDTGGIRISVEAEALQIDSERAVPFGLLVNELGTNAVKHAFPGGIGMVTLAVRRIGNDVELTVADDGIGMPAQGQGSTPGQHGSNYVTIFVRQLSGTLVRSGAPGVGTTFRILFPMSPDPENIPGQ
ncbi:PAS domain-containing sensor histidine kinase [Methylocystis sp.]|uniref:PAS domain-containing sensor histidine kinase n=1 Tax=Methylocystis sp. TaxID=1911079 RepID=UPI002736A18E|nr:PAS domain-containing sensor histidine kinase [Methylocystis sp.]MDP3555634.1 histidine kinase dimerization/phosphoacceptor domain -containing protein [Methylocystis sp.]